MPGNGDFFAEWGRARQKCTHFGRFGGIVRSVGGIVRSTGRVLGIVPSAHSWYNMNKCKAIAETHIADPIDVEDVMVEWWIYELFSNWP